MIETASVFQRRIVIGAGFCVMAFALVGMRLVDVTLIRAGNAAHAGLERAISARADLLDRNGASSARDLAVHDLDAHPHAFWDRDGAARDLAAATGSDAGRLMALFRGKHPYVLVARQLTPDQEDRVMHLGLPGLEFEPGA